MSRRIAAVSMWIYGADLLAGQLLFEYERRGDARGLAQLFKTFSADARDSADREYATGCSKAVAALRRAFERMGADFRHAVVVESARIGGDV